MHQKDLRIGGVNPKSSKTRGLLAFGILLAGCHFMAVERSVAGRAMDLEMSSGVDVGQTLPYPSSPVRFVATAYCEGGITKSGVPAAPGLAAGDISVLPLGTLIHVEGAMHWGIYRIMDTGRLVKGRIIDLYIPNLAAATKFGRQQVSVRILQYGPSKLIPRHLLSSEPTSGRPAPR